MRRKRMIKLLMSMGYDRNWSNDFARLFQTWPFLVSYGEFLEMLKDPYGYIGDKALARSIAAGRIPSMQELGIDVPQASYYEPDWCSCDDPRIPDSYGKHNPWKPSAWATGACTLLERMSADAARRITQRS